MVEILVTGYTVLRREFSVGRANCLGNAPFEIVVINRIKMDVHEQL